MHPLIFLVISFFLCLSFFPLEARSDNLNDAFPVGFDNNQKTLYLCLTHVFNSIQIGKTWKDYNFCNIPYGGKEYAISPFEVSLKQKLLGTYWQANNNLALNLGQQSNGMPLYLCQATYQGSTQPGKTWIGYDYCNIAYNGKEIALKNYRVLAIDRRSPESQTTTLPNSQCIQSIFGNVACGYHCVQSVNRVGCATSPDQTCVADNFGHIACGYGCVQSPIAAGCSKNPNEKCIISPLNEVACGKNCYIDAFNHIQCQH